MAKVFEGHNVHWIGGPTTSMLYFFHKRSKRLCIHTLPFFEHFLKPPWRHADQYHARLSPNVLEGVCRPTRDKHDRLSGRGQTIAPKSGPPTHIHQTEDEFFYVVKGEFKLKLGDRLASTPTAQ
jgi:hypothetical protein